jgi:uroporphyrinogen-III decarboxylase
MAQTSREIVTRCLKFEKPERMPIDIWVLPWFSTHYPNELAELFRQYPGDFAGTPAVYQPSNRRKGDPYVVGRYTDEWGCVFVNIQAGVQGEVKDPILKDVADWDQIEPPYEMLPKDPVKARDAIARSHEQTPKFVKAGCCPRPWEQMQFIRGTENAMIDIMSPELGGAQLLKKLHDFYMAELEFWVTTDVDAINFMDDWGSQNQLLIPPRIWRELFKPLYRDYCDIAHAHEKLVFMHSDGHISEIYDDLIEIGVDCLNSQLFCMDMADLERRAKGKITFWGEIDRQHILIAKDPQLGRDAVRKVARHFYDPAGGIIAEFELGAGSNPAVAFAILDEWQKVQADHA